MHVCWYTREVKRHIKSNHNIIYKEPYALLQPTTTTIVPKKIIQNDEKKKSVRQEGKTLHDESELAENKKTKRSKKKTGTCKIMEDATISLSAKQIQQYYLIN